MTSSKTSPRSETKDAPTLPIRQYWHTNLPTYGQVRYRDLFPGVDAVFFGKNGEIEYDLLLSPGSDPEKISFGLAGVQSMRLAGNGDLVIGLANGEVRQRFSSRPSARR